MGQTAICLFGSLYLYAFGPYGFSTARTSIADPAELCSRTLHWVEDSISWLEDVFGAFTSGEMSSPRCPGRVRKDKDPYLSVDCLLATIAGNQIAVERLNQLILVEETTQKWIAEQKENLLTSEMTLRSALQFLNVSGEVIRKADEILSEIPNLTVSDARCKCTPPAAPGSSNRNSLDFIL